MELGAWGELILKLLVLFAGVYVIIVLTPRLAAFIDKRKKSGPPEEPRPERVEDDIKTEENGRESDDK